MTMESTKSNPVMKALNKLFGGINMTWPKVILFAVATAVVTFIFLVVPIFENTSFERMGVTLEAWIFFAVIIMSNCKKPLESALKVFVFFLISQPLIYLLQVPFSSLGWELFSFYKTWFIWTLLTFPIAFIGWYINKKNWLSLLILAPVLGWLTFTYVNAFVDTVHHFPYLLVTALFCLGQVVVYLYLFTSNLWQKLLGFLVPLATVILLLLTQPMMELRATVFLPDEPVLTEEAVVSVADPEEAQVSIAETGPDSLVLVAANHYGSTTFTIRDGDREYRYSVRIYEDETGSNQVLITPLEE